MVAVSLKKKNNKKKTQKSNKQNQQNDTKDVVKEEPEKSAVSYVHPSSFDDPSPKATVKKITKNIQKKSVVFEPANATVVEVKTFLYKTTIL